MSFTKSLEEGEGATLQMDKDDILLPDMSTARKDKEEEEEADVVAVVDLAWLADYKSRMERAIHLVQSLARSELQPPGWALLPCDDRVQLHEKVGGGGATIATAIVKGRAERYAYIVRDYEPETRLAWDRQTTDSAQMETYHLQDTMHTMCFVHRRYPALVPGARDRWMQGIQSYFFDSSTCTHTIVFCSAVHPFYECPDDAVSVSGAILGVVVRQLEGKQCEIMLVAQYGDVASTVGGYGITASMYAGRLKEMLRERVRLLESVVRQWKKYYGPKRDPKKIENRK